MAKIYTGAQNFSSAFHYGSAVPMDDRSVVATYNDILNAETWKVNGVSTAYAGMVVVTKDSGRIYVFKGTDVTKAANWLDITASSSIVSEISNGAGGYMTQAELNTKFNNALGAVNKPLYMKGVTSTATDITSGTHTQGDVWIWNGTNKTTLASGKIVETGDMIIFTSDSNFEIVQKNFELDNYVQIGSASDDSSANTLYGAKKYAKEQADAVLGKSSDGATANTVYGAKAAVTALSGTAVSSSDEADNNIKASLGGTVGAPTIDLTITNATYATGGSGTEKSLSDGGVVTAAVMKEYVADKATSAINTATTWVEL